MKEQGDYNPKYLISAALLDDQVGTDQLTPERIQSPMLRQWSHELTYVPTRNTARFPRELAARITVRTRDGRSS
jgi:2-methylcitrate dehydratase